jgi:hypothetical protein
MLHPDLRHRLWVQEEKARIRELEFRRARREASEARRQEPGNAAHPARTKPRRVGFVEVATRLIQVGVSWISAL